MWWEGLGSDKILSMQKTQEQEQHFTPSELPIFTEHSYNLTAYTRADKFVATLKDENAKPEEISEAALSFIDSFARHCMEYGYGEKATPSDIGQIERLTNPLKKVEYVGKSGVRDVYELVVALEHAGVAEFLKHGFEVWDNGNKSYSASEATMEEAGDLLLSEVAKTYLKKVELKLSIEKLQDFRQDLFSAWGDVKATMQGGNFETRVENEPKLLANETDNPLENLLEVDPKRAFIELHRFLAKQRLNYYIVESLSNIVNDGDIRKFKANFEQLNAARIALELTSSGKDSITEDIAQVDNELEKPEVWRGLDYKTLEAVKNRLIAFRLATLNNPTSHYFYSILASFTNDSENPEIKAICDTALKMFRNAKDYEKYI